MGGSGSSRREADSTGRSDDPAGTTSGSAKKCPMQKNAAGKGICCVCKDTKAARDQCIVFNGEDKCSAFIEAHKQCLRREGFDVP